MLEFFSESKETLFVPAVDELFFKDILFSGIVNIFDFLTWSSVSFIHVVLSTMGLLH